MDERADVLLSIGLRAGNRWNRLASRDRWRLAVAYGDLGPDTLVEVERRSGVSQRPAHEVPELSDILPPRPKPAGPDQTDEDAPRAKAGPEDAAEGIELPRTGPVSDDVSTDLPDIDDAKLDNPISRRGTPAEAATPKQSQRIKVAVLEWKLATLKRGFTNNATRLGDLQNRLLNCRESLAPTEIRLIESDLATLRDRFADDATRLGDLRERLLNFAKAPTRTEISVIEQELATLKRRVDDAPGRLRDLHERLLNRAKASPAS